LRTKAAFFPSSARSSFASAVAAALLVGDYRRLAAHEVAEVGV
jgi:hypothetical protein